MDGRLPQTGGGLFLTDSGLETTLIFHDGMDLPCFAAFVLLDSEGGRARLARYYERHARIAQDAGLGFVFESATWRASADWGAKLGYDAAALDALNRRSIDLMREVRDGLKSDLPTVLSGQMGPRGDGYDPSALMEAGEAEAYHAPQLRAFAKAGADMAAALTMTNVPEAIGIVRAAGAVGLPVAVAFTVETDGRLPTGEPLGEAIGAVDGATDGAPAYFMINCAHPTHFAGVLEGAGAWVSRVRGLRANASKQSHAELDAATELDPGDPDALGREYAGLRRLLPNLAVLGGCCGTDHRHVEAICRACARAA